MGEEKVHTNIVVLGHVDSGKSVTVAHLIYKLGGFDKRLIESSFKSAWMLGQLKAERERGTTIDIAKWKFETSKYYCTVIDAPGNHNFIKSMITGTSQADCAIFVIDSTIGGFETGISEDGQIHEHALLARTLGVKQIIYCCNKMDATTPKFSKDRFDEIVQELSYRLMMVGYNRDMICFVPISGFEGDNLTEGSTSLDWYEGPTLLEAIDHIQEPKTPSDKPLRLPLLNVYESGNGTVAVGCVETGTLKPGMPITFGPSGFTTKVKSIEMNEKAVQMALPGQIVSFTVNKPSAEDLKCGYVASNSKKDPAKEATSFISQVNIMNNYEGEIRIGYTASLDCHTSHDAVMFSEILAKIDPVSGVPLENNPRVLKCGDAGLIKMVPRNPMVAEAFSEYPQLGCIVISDNNQTVAFGVIKSVEKKGTRGAKSGAKKAGKRAAAALGHALFMVVVQYFVGGCAAVKPPK